MAVTVIGADGLVRFRNDTRETVLKSTFAGVAATVLAAAIASPAGFGGLIGTSVAAGHGADSASTAEALGRLAPYPAPLTSDELAEIHTRLEVASASLDLLRASTEDELAQIRDLAGQSFDFAAPFAELQLPSIAMAAPAPAGAEAIESADLSLPPVAIDYAAPIENSAHVVSYAAEAPLADLRLELVETFSTL